jgi:hypothetical protein
VKWEALSNVWYEHVGGIAHVFSEAVSEIRSKPGYDGHSWYAMNDRHGRKVGQIVEIVAFTPPANGNPERVAATSFSLLDVTGGEE